MAPLADHEDPREFDGRGVDITWRSWRRGVGARNRVDVDEVAVLGEAIDEYRKAQRETPGAHAELRQMVEALVAARKAWAAIAETVR